MKQYKLNKGILIAIEGIDGAGKTTQALRLCDYFKRKGYKVKYLKEPTNGIYGEKIRDLAKNGRHTVSPQEEFELFINDRIEDCEYNIKPALDNKELVIIDRYYFSTIAYQGALGLNENYILKENEKIAIKPDLVIILDCAVKIGISRITNNRNDTQNHFEKEDYLEKVRVIFKKMQASYIQVIDGTPDEDTVFSHIRNIVGDIVAPYSSIDEDQLDLFSKNIGHDKVIFLDN